MLYMRFVLIAFDQCLNALCGGWPDETLSSRAYRWHVAGKGSLALHIINALFFWEKNHCQEAYESERRNRHLPPEFRT